MFSRQSYCLAVLVPMIVLGGIGPPLEAQSVRRSFRPGSSETSVAETSEERDSHWLVAETPSFQVWSPSKEVCPNGVGRDCENLRGRLITKWLGDNTPYVWLPKCAVVLHPTRESYLECVGWEAGDTAGSSLVTWRGGKVVMRRIDLRGDRIDFRTAALPHELTHVVLADIFPGRSLPRWADEGMAILEDESSKRSLQWRDLQLGLAEDRLFPLRDLLRTRDYPASHDWTIFYAQSASVVEYLVSQAPPRQLVSFLQRLTDDGLDRALRATYGINDVEELDRLWRAHLLATR